MRASDLPPSILSRLPGKAKKAPKAKLPPIDTGPFIEATCAERFQCGGWTRLVLPYPPNINHAYGFRIIRGKWVKPFVKPEGHQYKKAISDIGLAVGIKPLVGRVQLLIDVYRPRAAGDLDGIFKILLDSLPDIAYINDKQIKGICANQHDDPAFPRAVVSIRIAVGETLNFSDFLK